MSVAKYSLNSSTIRPTPILDKVRIAAAAGYTAIELWHDDIEQYLAGGGRLQTLRRAVDDAGLVVPTTIYLKGWWNPTAPDYRDSMAEVQRRLEHAAALGAAHVVASPPPWQDVDYAQLGAEYGRLLDAGLALGVRPAFEYLGFAPEVNSIDKAIRVIEASGHTAATIVLDPFHDFRGGAGHEAIARLQPSQIAISHFDDSPADPPWHAQHDHDRVYPGDGVIPLARYVSLLKQIGYTGFYSLELFRPDLWAADPAEVARTGLDKMRRVVEAALLA